MSIFDCVLCASGAAMLLFIWLRTRPSPSEVKIQELSELIREQKPPTAQEIAEAVADATTEAAAYAEEHGKIRCGRCTKHVPRWFSEDFKTEMKELVCLNCSQGMPYPLPNQCEDNYVDILQEEKRRQRALEADPESVLKRPARLYVLAISEQHPALADFAEHVGKVGLLVAICKGVQMEEALALNSDNQIARAEHWVLYRDAQNTDWMRDGAPELVLDAQEDLQ